MVTRLDARFAGREAEAAAEELLVLLGETAGEEVEALARLGDLPGFWILDAHRWPTGRAGRTSFETAVRLCGPPLGDRYLLLGTCLFGVTVGVLERGARVLGWRVEGHSSSRSPGWV